MAKHGLNETVSKISNHGDITVTGVTTHRSPQQAGGFIINKYFVISNITACR